MRLKAGARVRGLHTEILFAAMVAESIATRYPATVKFPELVITSGSDGSHSRGSRHYQGDAIDMRTWFWSPVVRQEVYLEVKAALGPDFDVIMEDTHIHIEFDPKES